ncbi:Swd3p NDAI_0C05770 [Naumovozyma dairenensis CBS 421]|uniref:Uncharacterized protein n=1 Tax=Naumovozyma dairenensis (strain ATCC 10597 / BCRC 20456 / CBS 421 / NBRC 0211 / NRRL Y-12639) TaxID=1071378 RepID=G0W8X5_NAUDC|nr:hypothetical protein NDAI_0C05770 [Naumovozyma dairenensis CBS 421]CCD24236.1 hypothetical protein NDAI_0C05770 [Naumovozyma dairenensis CBS 421]
MTMPEFELTVRGSIPLRITHSEDVPTSAKFSPNGEKIAICQGTTIILYDVQLRVTESILQTSHTKPISELCWSPDNQCIATASDDFTLEIRHLTYGPLHRLVGHTAPVVSLCYNGKGNLLYSSSMDESIKVWDVLNGILMKTISAHSESVVSVDICPEDSTVLSSGSFDGLIRLFDSSSGHCLKTLTYDKDWKSENGVVPISQVRFSKNGKYLLVKSFDGVVKIWDCIGGYVVRTFLALSEETRALKHSCGIDFLYPSDETLAPIVVSGYEHGELFCWNSENKKLLYSSMGNDNCHSGSPIISIHCRDNLVCTLSLNGECYVWGARFVTTVPTST